MSLLPSCPDWVHFARRLGEWSSPQEYFRDIEKHEMGFRWTGEHDGEALAPHELCKLGAPASKPWMCNV